MTAAGGRPEGDKSRSSYKIVLLLLVSIAVFYPKVVTFSGTLFHFDLIGFNAPVRSFFFGEIAKRNFPFWAPSECGGFPRFAEGQHGPLYPLNYPVFTFLPPWIALNLTVILHLVIAILGAWLWLKETHRSSSAAVGAVAYTFSSYMVYHLVHLMLFQSACLLPWLFLFVDRFLSKGRMSDVLAASLILGLMFTTGHQQGPILAVIGLCLYLAVIVIETWSAKSRQSAVATAGAGALIILLAMGMVAAVTHSIMELVSQSVRQGAMDASFAYSQSLTPDLLIRLVSPAHHGLEMDNLWRLSDYNEKEIAVYLGLGAFILAPAAFLGKLGRRGRAHIAILAFGFLFMLGSAGPFAGIFEHIPILDRLRIPPRILQVMTLSLAFLIASGVDRLLDAEIRTSKMLLLLPAAGALIWAAAAWGGALYSYGPSVIVQAIHGASSPSAADRLHALVGTDLFRRSLIAVAMVIAAWLLVRSARNGRRFQAMACLLTGALIFADMAYIGAHENPVADRSVFGPFQTVDFIKDRLDGYRVYSRIDHRPYGHGGWRNDVSSFRFGIEGLPHSTPLLFGIKTTSCGSPLNFARNSFVNQHLSLAWLRQMAVKYLLADKDLGLPVALDTGRVVVQEIPSPAPMFSLARQVVPVADPQEAFEALSKPVLDITSTAYVENFNADIPRPPENAAPGSVTVTESKTDLVRLRMSADYTSLLVYRSNYYPGWKASVDGNETPIYRTNYLYQGVLVPEGTHDVVFSYRPAKYIWEIIGGLALFFAVLLMALFYKPFRKESALAPLKHVGDAALESKILRSIALAFLALLVLAVIRHPEFWILSR